MGSRHRYGRMSREEKEARSSKVFDRIFRVAQLAFAGAVAGITGNHLQANRGQPSWRLGRFIYAEVNAAVSIFLALLFLFPLWNKIPRWPVDLVISICWFVAFGLLVDWINGACGNTFDWSGISFRGSGNTCGIWKADVAFTFVAPFCWLMSALIGWAVDPYNPHAKDDNRFRNFCLNILRCCYACCCACRHEQYGRT